MNLLGNIINLLCSGLVAFILDSSEMRYFHKISRKSRWQVFYKVYLVLQLRKCKFKSISDHFSPFFESFPDQNKRVMTTPRLSDVPYLWSHWFEHRTLLIKKKQQIEFFPHWMAHLQLPPRKSFCYFILAHRRRSHWASSKERETKP